MSAAKPSRCNIAKASLGDFPFPPTRLETDLPVATLISPKQRTISMRLDVGTHFTSEKESCIVDAHFGVFVRVYRLMCKFLGRKSSLQGVVALDRCSP